MTGTAPLALRALLFPASDSSERNSFAQVVRIAGRDFWVVVNPRNWRGRLMMQQMQQRPNRLGTKKPYSQLLEIGQCAPF